MRIYFSGLSLIAAPVRAGEFVRSFWLLGKYNVPIKVGFAVTFAERIGELISAILIIFWSIYGSLKTFLLSMLLLLLINYIFSNKLILNRIREYLARISILKKVYEKSSLLQKANETIFSLTSLLSLLPLSLTIFVSGIAWLIESFLVCLIDNMF